MNFALTDTQWSAVKMALQLKHQKDPFPRVGILGGYAGTGKTTTVREVVNAAQGDVIILTPTGKAALRAVEATGHYATTIHRWIYKPFQNDKTGRVGFRRRELDEIERPSSGLIVLDESSMVGIDLWNDVKDVCEKLRLNILCVGDMFQLPPVVGSFSPLTLDVPTERKVVLTEVHRQALDSPILAAATLIRQGNVKDALAMLPHLDPEDALPEIDRVSKDGGVTICFTNQTRNVLNFDIRKRRGYPDDLQKGEPILVLKNNHTLGMMNGEVATIREVLGSTSSIRIKDWRSKQEMPSVYHAVMLEDGRQVLLCHEEVHGRIPLMPSIAIDGSLKSTIESEEERNNIPAMIIPLASQDHPVINANLGYALTCHKAQGSEWDEVLVYLESRISLKEEEGMRWLYTAVTRARKKVTIRRRIR